MAHKQLAIRLGNPPIGEDRGHRMPDQLRPPATRKAGIPEDMLQALRNRQPIEDARLEQLRRFAEAVAETRGVAGDGAVDAFVTAGFTRAQLLEVVAIIATKVISNYTNHLTHTPLEDFMSDAALRWVDQQGRTTREPMAA